MNIVFLSNYQKTVFLFSIAKQLEKRGITIFWASPSRKWSNWLKENGVTENNLFDVTEYGEQWVKRSDTISSFKTLEQLEQESNTSVRDNILQDRSLSQKSFYRSRAYLEVTAKRFLSFLGEKKIDLLVGEQTWAFERIIGQVCRTKGATIVRPRPVRIPSNRFGFFKGVDDRALLKIRSDKNKDYKQAKLFISNYEKDKPKPPRFDLNQKLPTPKLEWLSKPFKAGEDPYDETRFQWRDIRNYSPRDVNQTLRMVKTMVRQPFEVKEVPSGPFVFITLHRQPEASVDVFGSYFSNQFETIRAIARSVPVSHRVLVKEHSHGIGDRGPSFYSKLNSIPGVDLVDPYADTFSFIEKADLVLSISGTACYEAAVLGRRAVTIAPMFFGPLLVCNGWNPFDSSVREVAKWLNTKENIPSYSERVDFLASVITQTFTGTISDPSHDKSCMDKSNIEKVTKAFLVMIDKFRGD